MGSRLQYATDLQGLDAFHHAILHNNTTAMRLFFSKHLFERPHQPKANPYLHVASKVGCLPAISILLHERRTIGWFTRSDGQFYQKARLEIPYYLLHKDDPADFKRCSSCSSCSSVVQALMNDGDNDGMKDLGFLRKILID
jgi:hypothetical protein